MTLPPRHVRRDLARLVESEELGEAFFLAAAKHSADDTRASGWAALHHLEAQTNQGAQDFIEQCGLQVKTSNVVAVGLGGASGTGLHLMPYSVQLSSLRLGTRRYLPAFRRLAEHYRGTEHSAFFDYVVAHELAIIDFTRRAGSADALDAVHRLLDSGVPR